MMGTIVAKYLFDNFAFLLCTPLSVYLFQYIVEIWNDQDFKLMKNMNYEERKKMIRVIYDKDPYKYLDLMKCEDENEKQVIEELIQNIRKDVKYPDILHSETNKYDEEIYKLIIDKIIKIKIKNKFDLIEKNIQHIEERMKESSFPNPLIKVFEKYFDRILEDMIDLEKFVDSQRVIFIKNYYDLIYDIKKDNLTKDEIKYVVKKKICEFYENVKKYESEITIKYNTYINILTKWIDIYDQGNTMIKIYNYPYVNSFEKISIYEDICSHGERYLIKLVSPIINEMSSEEKNKILFKMSSGTKLECERYFINEYDVAQKMLILSQNDSFVKKIKFKATNQKEFDQKIKNISDEIHNLITMKK